MKYLTGLLFLSVMVIAGCGDTPDSQLINDAHESVKKELAKKYKPGECQKWQFMESSGVIKAGASKLVCDSEFNIDKGLRFSEEKCIGMTDLMRYAGSIWLYRCRKN